MPLLIILLFIPLSWGQTKNCQDLIKLEATIDLKKSSWETTELEKKPSPVCVSIHDDNANLELTFRKDKKVMSVRIFSSLIGFYDHLDEKKKQVGGTYDIREVFIETWAPSWARGSTLVVTEIATKKKITETKL